jgi:hypothetical protein
MICFLFHMMGTELHGLLRAARVVAGVENIVHVALVTLVAVYVMLPICF